MGSGAPDEGRKTTENDADTASLRDDDPDRSIPYIGTYLYTDPDERDDARHALAYQRGPGLWLPLVIFVVLLVSVALLGRYLWPGAPTAEAAPSASATPSRSAGNNPVGLPSGPTLPSPPTPPARPADLLSGWAERVSAAIAVPRVAVEAYGYAQLMLQRNDATCHLGWTTLAGIGEVASRHGQAAGATLQDNGRSVPPVVGPLLNGQGGQPLVKDTDAGAYDGDATYDRAMGPLLILPSVWSAHAADADGDAILDPYDIDDAALAFAAMLCAGAEDLNELAGWTAAIGRVDPARAYAKSVFEAADSYGQRTRSIQ